MEIAVALLLFAVGALVVVDSYRLGANWGDDGPQSGYFPFYIGLLLCIASVATLVASRDRPMAAAGQLPGRGRRAHEPVRRVGASSSWCFRC